MKFTDFLSEISGLPSFRVLDAESLYPAEDSTRQVSIGWGRWSQELAVSREPFLLTNKGTAQHFGLARDYTSVTKFVLSPPKGYLESWDLWANRPLAPSSAVAAMTVVADDASPDSVMALLLLLAHLADVNLAEVPSAWVDAVDYWEQAGVADNPWRSWCALESALVHTCFSRRERATPGSFGLAWRDALRFAGRCMALHLSPGNIPELPFVAEYVKAKAAMEMEQEIYWDWLQRAAAVQVSLPLRGVAGRRMLVDGLIVEVQQITGVTKVFCRNDRENSSLGRGFSFLALCSHAAPGEPVEMTISVDPHRGVSLLQLWQAIERRESKAWEDMGEMRPTDSPRSMEGVSNFYQEPWFIDSTQTLIGSPRKLKSGEPGSRLEWRDICETIWQELNPLRGVKVHRSDTNDLVQLLEVGPEREKPGHAKHFFAAKWFNSSDEDSLILPRSLSSSTFFLRILAAKLIHGRSPDSLGLRDLPTLGSWEVVKLDGGVAIVNTHGLFVLDDWSEQALDVSEIRSDFHRAATLDVELIRLEKHDLSPLVKDVQKLLRQESHAPDIDDLLRRAANLNARLAEKRGDYAMLPEAPDARLIRSTIEKCWSLDRRLAACESETRALETSLHSLSELGTARIGRFIGTYGFALIVAMESCQIVAKAIYHALKYNKVETDPPSLFTFICCVAMVLLLSLLLNRLLALDKPLKRKANKDG